MSRTSMAWMAAALMASTAPSFAQNSTSGSTGMSGMSGMSGKMAPSTNAGTNMGTTPDSGSVKGATDSKGTGDNAVLNAAGEKPPGTNGSSSTKANSPAMSQ